MGSRQTKTSPRWLVRTIPYHQATQRYPLGDLDAFLWQPVIVELVSKDTDPDYSDGTDSVSDEPV